MIGCRAIFILGAGILVTPEEAYQLYPEKLLPKTWDLLNRANLSGELLPNSDYPMTQFGGLMVMSILADSCAGSTRSRVTDRSEAYAILSGYLGNRPQAKKIKKEDAHGQFIPIGLRVLDAPAMDLDFLIKVRGRERRESDHSLETLRHRHLASLEEYVEKITTEKSRKSDAEEIRRQYESDMPKDLIELQKELGFARRKAFLSKEILVTALAAIGTVASWTLDMPVALGDVVALGGPPVAIGGIFGARNKYLRADPRSLDSARSV
jgi:hypothetical protein